MCSSEGGSGDVAGEEDHNPEVTLSQAADDGPVEDSQSPKSPAEQFRQGDVRSTGAGLSAEELQELHKTDPKKVKRILANRSSAARSKVRKLRYIAELDSKSACLHQQVTEMSAELRALQEGTSRLGAENQWLFSQVVELQDQSLRLDEELETLQVHVRQSRALSRALSNPSLASTPKLPPPSSLAFREPHQQRRPAVLDAPTAPGHVHIPVSAFQNALQEPQLHPLLLPGQGLLGSLPPPPLHGVGAPTYPGYPAPLPQDQQAFGKDRGYSGAALQSHNSSDGSGMSSTTQELRLGPEDPALLDLLRSFDLGTPRPRNPALPLPPNSLARYDRSRTTNLACDSISSILGTQNSPQVS